MTIHTRRNNPGQPDLDGRTCYGCGDDAQVNVEFHKPGGNLTLELRLCGPCRSELRSALETAPPPLAPVVEASTCAFCGGRGRVRHGDIGCTRVCSGCNGTGRPA